jgi:hypothetical protein
VRTPEQGKRLSLVVVIFLVALVIPLLLQVGGLRLSAYRLVLIALTVPLVFMWLTGRAGRIRVADIALVLLSIWATVSLAVVHGIGVAVEAGGIFFVETVGAFLLARCFVRDERSFRQVVGVLFTIVAVLAPFAMVEALTGVNVPMRAFDAVGETYPAFRMEPRLGLERVQSIFEHPILFGVFCGALIGLAWKVLGYGRGFLRKTAATSFVVFTAFLSLSSGPLAGILAQIILVIYDAIFRRLRFRWWLAAVCGGIFSFFLEIASTRPLPAVFISYFALNSYTAYLRLLIWHFGLASIFAHPLFGIGLNDYERPSWMSASIDMFWIVFAVRHGIPAWILTFVPFFAVLLPVIFKRGLTARQAEYRLGFVFAMIGLFISGWTVHFWNATYVLFMFLLGSGVWLLDAKGGSMRTKRRG